MPLNDDSLARGGDRGPRESPFYVGPDEPHWATQHAWYIESINQQIQSGTGPIDKELLRGRDEITRWMQTGEYAKQAADPRHAQYFPDHVPWLKAFPGVADEIGSAMTGLRGDYTSGEEIPSPRPDTRR